MANKKLLAAVLVVLLAAVAVVAVWYMYRYDAGVLALTFETTPP